MLDLGAFIEEASACRLNCIYLGFGSFAGAVDADLVGLGSKVGWWVYFAVLAAPADAAAMTSVEVHRCMFRGNWRLVLDVDAMLLLQ